MYRVDGRDADSEPGGKLGVGVAAPQVGQGEQGLTADGQSSPPGPDLPLPNCELLGQVPQGTAGQIDRRRVDKHAKLLAARVILVEHPSTRSFVVPYSPHRPTPQPRRQVGKGSVIKP